MSCGIEGESCETPRRRQALIVLALMTGIFIALSVFSFVKSRGQVIPSEVAFGPYKAIAGKRVFQAYDCMGCHTLVGNGAYLAPDLTNEYKRTGPAWLAAFLPSAGSWPTKAAVRGQLLDPIQQADTGTQTIEAYLEKFPGAARRIERRGGSSSEMPNLPLTKVQIGDLIAYLKYTSELNTEGWPPKVEVPGFDHRLRLAGDVVPDAQAAPVTASSVPAGPLSPAAHGAQLVKDNGCVACHSTGSQRLVGPGWGGLYDSKVKLSDGSTVVANDAYLRESILQPNAQIVAGYPKGVMPEDYHSLLTAGDVDDIVVYLHTLRKQ